MSVINQVLNQLEQRGAQTAAEQTMVRAVPYARRNFAIPLLVFGFAVAAGIAAWQWKQAQRPAVPAAPAQHPRVAAVKPETKVPAMNLPASRMSFELSSVPLPSTPRQEPVPTASNPKSSSAGKRGTSENREMPVKPVKKTQPSGQANAAAADTYATQSDSAAPIKQISPEQQADAEFRKGVALMQQGRVDEAMTQYKTALRLDPGNDAARQALVALLLESKRGADAEQVLQDRLKNKPDHMVFTMMLARLQVERGAVAEATATLEKALPYAGSQADFQAFLAALLQRQNRNDEAIRHYQIALQLAPNNGIWQMGYGISLQALQRNADAKAAFQRALDTQTLSPDLQAFVQLKLKGFQ